MDNLTPKEIGITGNIVSQFAEYSMMFHFDNQNNKDIDFIIGHVCDNTSYFMINYDLKANNSHILMRPPGYKYLHVVLLQEYQRFNRYMEDGQFNLEYNDIILFVINSHMNEKTVQTNSSKKYQLWENNRLNRSGTVFVLDSMDLSLYTICFFCGNLSKELRKIDGLLVKDDKVIVPSLHVYTNKFDKFNNHVFRIAYTEYKPYFWVVKSNQSTREIFGSEGELLVVLSHKLEFNVNLIEFAGMSDIWKSMLNAVGDRKVDWAVSGITVSMERIQISDFTNFIRPEPYTALYAVYEDIWMSWQNILTPFELKLWIALIITTCIVAFVLYLAIKFTHPGKNFDLIFYIQGCMRYLVEQPIDAIPPLLKSRWTTEWLLALWFMMALIITTAYKSKLTSSLINSRANEPNAIDGLVKLGFSFQVNKEDSSLLQSHLRYSNDPVFLEVLKRSKNDTDFCPSVMKTINNRIAVIDEETTLNYEVLTNCRKKMSLLEQETLRLIRDELFPSTQAWPLQLAAPYRNSFNSIISRLQAAGLFSKWQDDSVSGGVQLLPKSHQGSSTRSDPSFNIVTMLGPALIWMLGISCSCVVFIFEKFKRCTKKNKVK